MANWVIPDEGKILADQRWIGANGAASENYSLRLFSNNYTPDDDSTLSSFTLASFTGYANVAITNTDFSTPTITSHVAISTAPDAVFTCTAGTQTIYGAYLVGVTSGKIIAACRFDNARAMAAGATETVTPTLKFKTFA